jgi:hypothetical protein
VGNDGIFYWGWNWEAYWAIYDLKVLLREEEMMEYDVKVG